MIGLISLIKTQKFWVIMGSNVLFRYDWPIKPQNVCPWLVKSSQQKSRIVKFQLTILFVHLFFLSFLIETISLLGSDLSKYFGSQDYFFMTVRGKQQVPNLTEKLEDILWRDQIIFAPGQGNFGRFLGFLDFFKTS